MNSRTLYKKYDRNSKAGDGFFLLSECARECAFGVCDPKATSGIKQKQHEYFGLHGGNICGKIKMAEIMAEKIVTRAEKAYK